MSSMGNEGMQVKDKKETQTNDKDNKKERNRGEKSQGT
jgi:hypothetical protein